MTSRSNITIAAIAALFALTACNPLDPPVQFNQAPATVNISEGDEPGCDPSGEGCPTPPTPEPSTPCSPEGGNICLDEGGVPIPTTTAVPPTPNICEAGDSEGGLPC